MGVRGGVRALKDRACMPALQTDAVLSQANPVSATLYPVLPTTRNVRIIDIAADITWAVTQPTPLEVVCTIDGIPYIFVVANPVTATKYHAVFSGNAVETSQPLQTTQFEFQRSFLMDTRSIKIDERITWAVTQPTPLACRVKWAKW